RLAEQARWATRSSARGGSMRGFHGGLMAALVLVLLSCSGCAPSMQHAADEHEEWAAKAELTGDLDEAEARWRREMVYNNCPDSDAHLLTDDPPKAPKEYGKVTFEHGEEAPPPPPPTTWDSFKAGMDKVGKASFAAMTVLVTVGMMVAPYFMMM